MTPKTRNGDAVVFIGRGAFSEGRSEVARLRGLRRSENVGMSNAKCVRNTLTESPRVPGEGSSTQGKAGPKARPKGVVDGQQVDIPAPCQSRYDRRGDAGS